MCNKLKELIEFARTKNYVKKGEIIETMLGDMQYKVEDDGILYARKVSRNIEPFREATAFEIYKFTTLGDYVTVKKPEDKTTIMVEDLQNKKYFLDESKVIVYMDELVSVGLVNPTNEDRLEIIHLKNEEEIKKIYDNLEKLETEGESDKRVFTLLVLNKLNENGLKEKINEVGSKLNCRCVLIN